jgi:hypothetical protein
MPSKGSMSASKAAPGWRGRGCLGDTGDRIACSQDQLPVIIRNLSTTGLDSGSSWLDGVNGILMQQEPDSPKQDHWNQRAIASLANTLITVVEPVPTPVLSSMLLLQL